MILIRLSLYFLKLLHGPVIKSFPDLVLCYFRSSGISFVLELKNVAGAPDIGIYGYKICTASSGIRSFTVPGTAESAYKNGFLFRIFTVFLFTGILKIRFINLQVFILLKAVRKNEFAVVLYL